MCLKKRHWQCTSTDFSNFWPRCCWKSMLSYDMVICYPTSSDNNCTTYSLRKRQPQIIALFSHAVCHYFDLLYFFGIHQPILIFSCRQYGHIIKYNVQIVFLNYVQNGHKPKRPQVRPKRPHRASKTATNQNGHNQNGHMIWSLDQRTCEQIVFSWQTGNYKARHLNHPKSRF